ncbi:DNA mismatch repair protein mutL [Stagonosporopsis vannaccii]|nr:DNA mismatch repair protein mutL [Stagonosporopsis vannaccii]
MEGDAEGWALPAISALPPATVRQLGSHQLLIDPSSVVKELIDNSLDARAKSIFVDIAANTIDSIQVKDDGHGIPGEDRALACRRYYTSKIRDFHDLKQVGGKWLGFRGEALASVADMSGTVLVTTRVEGESVAVKLAYHRNGELVRTERASHPVGTTVKITKLLESAKVRKEMAAKNAVKCLAKIRRLMQAYALARPATRFRLHVLKAKNNKGEFVYAPKVNANLEDAAFKVIGKDCALQCDWTALELDGFDLQAFLPKPDADGSKIANYGSFISIDSRPVCAVRGTLQKVATAVRSKMRKTNPTLANIKDPFFCMNITCPVDSYDPNIEPAKDDVIFCNESFVVALVHRVLSTHYPEERNGINPAERMEFKGPDLPQPDQGPDLEQLMPESQSSLLSSVDQDDVLEIPAVSSSASRTQQPRWRPSNYGNDEETLGLMQPSTPFAIVEEQGCRNAAISNPWTIARMNSPVKFSNDATNEQVISPAKGPGDAPIVHLTSTPSTTSNRSRLFEAVTPQSTQQANAPQHGLDEELQRSIQHLPQVSSSNIAISSLKSGPPTSSNMKMPTGSVQLAPQPLIPTGPRAGRPKLRRNEGSRPPSQNKLIAPPALRSDDTWFGQPMRGARETTHPQVPPRQSVATCSPNDGTYSSPRSLVLPVAEHLVETRLASESNADIRRFFSKSKRDRSCNVSSAGIRKTQPPNIADQLQAYAKESPVLVSPRRPQSADSTQRSLDTAREMDRMFQVHQKIPPGRQSGSFRGFKPSDMATLAKLAPSLRRCRTAEDDLHRTKSSTLPLNCVPHGYETHTLSLTVITSLSAISRHARRLDMTANSLKWGYDSTEAFDVFDSTISKRKIMEWVSKVDDLLGTVFERVDGVDVRGALHEGIQRFLDTRKEEEEEDRKHAILTTNTDISDSMNLEDGSQVINGRLPRGPPRNVLCGLGQVDDERTYAAAVWVATATETATESNEYEDNFDLSQVVEVKDEVRQVSPVRNVKTEDDFGDCIDDVMLMDL